MVFRRSSQAAKRFDNVNIMALLTLNGR